MAETLAQTRVGVRRLEELLGLPRWSLRGVIDGQTPSLDKAKEIAEALGLELYIGPPRGGAEPAGDFALVPLHAAALSAGPGADAGDADRVETLLAFRRDWLARLGLPPARAALARIRGDSMEPRLKDGDLVLIDTARTDPARPLRGPEGNIFALRHQGELIVKRVERPPTPPRTPDDPALILVSENWSYPPLRVARSALEDGSTAVLGLVRWWGHVATTQP
ncbi:putative transcriptional regulator [Rubellimicrobium thermophilum DSM 16684]|uniref:Putative transcriptional regulator n=1 Tax=Rubellimicrobium thermophilum DSM 16684 TaxID=1123069 RepID=S9S7T5_9RHOB|nr:S24 family peptidase [Rubellimicrobium thermophilum]EPX82304.1 putative transcriptional regulator [Rubellimicrobium thermophilum DSM 16684]